MQTFCPLNYKSSLTQLTVPHTDIRTYGVTNTYSRFLTKRNLLVLKKLAEKEMKENQ